MRLWPLLILLTVARASAFTGQTVDLRDGTSDEARDLPPVWVMACAAQDRLVGLRMHHDSEAATYTGIQAICVPLRQDNGGIRWLAAPHLGPEPPPPAPPETPADPQYETRVIRRAGEGTVLEARSGDVRRYRTESHAEIITIRRKLPEGDGDEADDNDGEADGADGVDAQAPNTMNFEEADAPIDIVCPRNSFVTGLKSGTASNQLTAVQIICGDGTNRPVATVGDWPQPDAPQTGRRHHRHRYSPPALAVQRIECSRDNANPHDGLVGQSVFGATDDGEIDSIGLSCARSIDDGRLGSPTTARVLTWLDEAIDRAGVSWPVGEPTWFDGSAIAACGGRRGDQTCNTDTANAYCKQVAGYARATRFDVGPYVEDAVSPDGRHCDKGSCRGFTAITCTL